MAPVGTKSTTFSTLWVALLTRWMAAPPAEAEMAYSSLRAKESPPVDASPYLAKSVSRR